MMRVLVGNPPPHILLQKPEDLDWQNFSAEELLSLANSETLFGESLTFRFLGALAGERGEEFLKVTKELQASAHLFIFEEEKLLKGPTTLLEKVGAKIEVHKTPIKKERGFDPFGVTAALAQRDRKKLWLGVVKSLSSGEKPEAVAGILVWKVRQMLTAHTPYGTSTKYTPGELKNVSRQLVALYHDSHRGAGDLALLLEKFALTL